MKGKLPHLLVSFGPVALSGLWFAFGTTQKTVMYFQMVDKLSTSVIVLVLANTVLYSRDVFSITRDHATKSSGPAIGWSSVFVYLSLVLCVLWAGSVYFSEELAQRFHQDAERFHLWLGVIPPLMIFFAFLAADFLLMRFFMSLRTQLRGSVETSAGLPVVEVELAYFKSLVKFGDIPIILGLFLLAGLLSIFRPEAQTSVRHAESFLAGATLMHIVTSQIIFVFISLSRYLPDFPKAQPATVPSLEISN